MVFVLILNYFFSSYINEVLRSILFFFVYFIQS